MRTFTLSFVLMMGMLVARAQSFPVQFADAQGNVIADGTKLTLDKPEIEVSEFDDAILMPSGVYVLNTTSGEVACGTKYAITHISNGAFQTCFPVNCVMQKTTGSWTSEVGTLSANQLKDMLTEWLPVSAGSADAEFQLLTYKVNPVTKKYQVDQNGPQIQMHFVYDPSGIRAVDNTLGTVSSVAYYTLDGRRVAAPIHGLYLVRVTYANGVSKTTKQQF